MKRHWSNSRNLTKNDQIASFFSKIGTKLRQKKIRRPTWYFWTKIETERVILNVLYKLVKILYLLFMIIKKLKTKLLLLL